MADLAPEERLQPSLLDRLTDDEREKSEESREQRVLSAAQLRAGVLRDLAWLLNTGRLSDVEDLSHTPEAEHSVINFGVPDLTGGSSLGLDRGEIERSIRQAIIDFEPRIIPASVQVRLVVREEEATARAVTIEISGDLWNEPMPEHLFLKTEIDLQTGEASLGEGGAR
ncbi:MAG: type VI secretion system baseplate subunit TssE [Planctomycetota bacterium]